MLQGTETLVLNIRISNTALLSVYIKNTSTALSVTLVDLTSSFVLQATFVIVLKIPVPFYNHQNQSVLL